MSEVEYGNIPPLVSIAAASVQAYRTDHGLRFYIYYTARLDAQLSSRGNTYLWEASFVAGTCCYLVSARGAHKLCVSHVHSEMFCVDDFMNATNSFRSHEHINPRIQNSTCVGRLLSLSGLQIYYANMRKAGGIAVVPTLKQTKAASASDTRYDVHNE